MTPEQKAELFSCLVTVVRRAGLLALSSQSTIVNVGKKESGFDSDSEMLRIKRAAKTNIDDAVQELILTSLQELLDPNEVTIDAEEDTPSLSRFPNKKSDVSIIIDPIDGTFEYIRGDDSYSVCVGVIETGKLLLATVYFPVRDVLYCINDKHVSQVLHEFSQNQIEDAQTIEIKDHPSLKRIYKNSRVSQTIVESLQKDGYEVLDDTLDDIGKPDAMLKPLSYESIGYIAHSRQIRDVLQGAIVGNARGGFSSDWQGQELIWPRAGRLPHAVFGIQKYKNEIIEKTSAI